MARNGVAGFVNASAMVPGGSVFALDIAAGAPAGATVVACMWACDCTACWADVGAMCVYWCCCCVHAGA